MNLTKPKVIFADELKIESIRKVVNETNEHISLVCLNEAPGFESLSRIVDTQSSDEVAKFACKDLEDLSEPALIIYTSGTTGYPKGAVLPYGWIWPYIAPILETPNIYFWPAGISWSTAILSSFITISSCSTAVLHPSPNEEIILEIIEKYKVC